MRSMGAWVAMLMGVLAACVSELATTDFPAVTSVGRVVLEDSAAGLAWPTGLALDPDGGFYLLEIGAGAVYRFSANGHFIRRYGSLGDGPGELRLPVAAAAIDSLVVVSDFAHQALELFRRADGTALKRIPLPMRAEVLTAASSELLAGGLSIGSGTSYARVAIPAWTITLEGQVPASYLPAGVLMSAYRRVFPAVLGPGKLAVGYEAFDSLDVQADGSHWTRLPLLLRLRRGVVKDANKTLVGSPFDKLLIAQSSLIAVGGRRDGGIAVVHSDQRLTRPPPVVPDANGRLPVTADLYVSVIAPDRRRACVDAPVSGSGELPPQVARRGDTLFVLDQITTGATTRTVVNKFTIATDHCRWRPLAP